VCVGRGCHGLRRMSCGRDGVVASHDAISHVRFIASQARSMTQSARKVASRHGHAGAHSCTDNDRTRRDLTSARTRPIAASDQSDAPTCALDDSSRSGRASGMHVVSCGSGRPARLATEPASEGVSVGHTPGAAACGGHEARAAVVHSKSQAGFGARFRASLPCRCHPKRSTGACSSKAAASSDAPSSDSSVGSTIFARHSARLRPRPGQILDAVSIRPRPTEFGTEDSPAHDEWFYGLPYERPDGFRRSSPLTYITRARTPTLILQGDADVVDPPGQSQALYRALKRYGVETDYVVYPREGHGLAEEKHVVDRLTRIVALFDKYLKYR
jgi:pimeloyl-ACP methyl ester carboxylesterase